MGGGLGWGWLHSYKREKIHRVTKKKITSLKINKQISLKNQKVTLTCTCTADHRHSGRVAQSTAPDTLCLLSTGTHCEQQGWCLPVSLQGPRRLVEGGSTSAYRTFRGSSPFHQHSLGS